MGQEGWITSFSRWLGVSGNYVETELRDGEVGEVEFMDVEVVCVHGRVFMA